MPWWHECLLCPHCRLLWWNGIRWGCLKCRLLKGCLKNRLLIRCLDDRLLSGYGHRLLA